MALDLDYFSQFCDTSLASRCPLDWYNLFPFEQPIRYQFLPTLRLQEGQQVVRFGSEQFHEDETLVLVAPDDDGNFWVTYQ